MDPSRGIDARLRQLVRAVAIVMAAVLLPATPAVAGSGGTKYRAHVFPVQAPHWTRGAIGEFGAPRSGGRTHEGFDVAAACGTPLVAVRGGRVLRAGFDPVLYGNYLTIHGEGEGRSYFYAHLPRSAPVHRGERLYTGERVGSVGMTGNARTVGCHLHFEVRVHGRRSTPGRTCAAGAATAKEPAFRQCDFLLASVHWIYYVALH